MRIYLSIAILLTAQCHATALEHLNMPKGLKRPTATATPASQMASRATTKKLIGKLVEPPVRLVQKHKIAPANKTKVIRPSRQIADTQHMAVALKQSGYRLYKKRTRLSEESWIYWLKTPTGEPSYKVEVHWLNPEKTQANINIWSWDDTTQFDLKDMNKLVSLFTR